MAAQAGKDKKKEQGYRLVQSKLRQLLPLPRVKGQQRPSQEKNKRQRKSPWKKREGEEAVMLPS